jgi:hypothetical protein
MRLKCLRENSLWRNTLGARAVVSHISQKTSEMWGTRGPFWGEENEGIKPRILYNERFRGFKNPRPGSEVRGYTNRLAGTCFLASQTAFIG